MASSTVALDPQTFDFATQNPGTSPVPRERWVALDPPDTLTVIDSFGSFVMFAA